MLMLNGLSVQSMPKAGRIPPFVPATPTGASKLCALSATTSYLFDRLWTTFDFRFSIFDEIASGYSIAKDYYSIGEIFSY
jgi:hypothetical protein